jgi:hypothetical protein
MRNKREEETYAQYLQAMIDEIIDHGKYFIVISKPSDMSSGQVAVETQYIQKEFPNNQVHVVLQRVAASFADNLVRKEKPVNIIIREGGEEE